MLLFIYLFLLAELAGSVLNPSLLREALWGALPPSWWGDVPAGRSAPGQLVRRTRTGAPLGARMPLGFVGSSPLPRSGQGLCRGRVEQTPPSSTPSNCRLVLQDVAKNSPNTGVLSGLVFLCLILREEKEETREEVRLKSQHRWRLDSFSLQTKCWKETTYFIQEVKSHMIGKRRCLSSPLTVQLISKRAPQRYLRMGPHSPAPAPACVWACAHTEARVCECRRVRACAGVCARLPASAHVSRRLCACGSVAGSRERERRRN